MDRNQKYDISESVEDLKLLKRQQTKMYLEKRASAILYLKQERFSNQIDLAHYLGVTQRAVQKWLSVYRKRGLDVLLSSKKRVIKSKFISKEMHDDLASKLKSIDSPLLGYSHAKDYLNTNYNLELGYHVVRDYLRNHLNSRIKRPRKSHVKKDEKAVDAFLKTS